MPSIRSQSLLALGIIIVAAFALAADPEPQGQAGEEAGQTVERVLETQDVLVLELEKASLRERMRLAPDEFVAPLKRELDITDSWSTLADQDRVLRAERALRLSELLGAGAGADLVLDTFRRTSESAVAVESTLPRRGSAERRRLAADEDWTRNELALANALSLRRQALAVLGRLGDSRVVDEVFARIDREDQASFHTMLQYLHDIAPTEPRVTAELRKRYDEKGSSLYRHPAVTGTLKTLDDAGSPRQAQ